MKKSENYRQIYKDYYGIDFGNEYAIHHIDHNHANNDIRNLILLPKSVHSRYHFIMNNFLGRPFEECFKEYVIDSVLVGGNYGFQSMDKITQIRDEMRYWSELRSVMGNIVYHNNSMGIPLKSLPSDITYLHCNYHKTLRLWF